MLILRRREGERIRLSLPDGRGGRVEVWVTLLEVHARVASVGIDAPDEVAIEREEVARERDRG